MPFWTYMLHCADRSFYVGHTDDLDARIGQHHDGSGGGHTARLRPVKLVWCQEFATRYEALSAERQIKGWGRLKKLALIRGDWATISRLAKARSGPSTGSGRTDWGDIDLPRTVRPELVEGHSFYLLRHPTTGAPAVASLQAFIRVEGKRLHLRYSLRGEIADLRIAAPRPPARADNLWQHTCFEAFVRPPGGAAYVEINLSPSREWAVYTFEGRREGMAPAEIAAPEIIVTRGRHALELSAEVHLPFHPAGAAVNLTAVVEARDGTRSFWALAHPADGPPDFHDPACFVLELPPATS